MRTTDYYIFSQISKNVIENFDIILRLEVLDNISSKILSESNNIYHEALAQK